MLIGLMGWGCGHDKKSGALVADAANNNTLVLTQAQYSNAGITTVFLQSASIPVQLQLNGKIDVPPQNLVSISVPLGGYLRSTALLPGMHVRKGEVLAVMEDQQYIQLQQDYLSAKSKLYFSELEYARQKELNPSQASSNKVMQQALAEVEQLRILVSASAQKLKLINKNPDQISAANISKTITIYSSIDGYVSKVNVNIGKYVTPADVIFELIDPSDIHLNLKVFEKDISSLAIGQSIKAYSNVDTTRVYTCKIILISKDIDADGTGEVHCHFDNFDKSILPGMYMNATVQLLTVQTNALPEESVVNFEGKAYVFIETKKMHFEMVEVMPGRSSNGFIAIGNTELLRDKPIVANGAYTLLMKVKNKEE
ncbi:MAG: efflux RND transporter periplasmic adaptor subunit [Bacteroidetes bacterium]|nr:MAG: efflux RND transporter periplasmic adaptor subunit [Bacteroidota bacterium]